MKIIAFGDSFTAGEGTNHSHTKNLSTFEEVEKYQKEHSWPKYMGDEFDLKWENFGEIGSTNYRIFSNIFEQFARDKINKDDLVIIMWSSSIRDPLPFFPNIFSRTGPVGLSWSMKELEGEDARKLFTDRYYKDSTIRNYLDKDLSKFMSGYFNFYLKNLYDEEYYKKLNTNYIVFLQEYFKYKNQKYIMCDAFDKMIFDENLVDVKTYYNEKTIYDFLVQQEQDVFEDSKYDYHPEGKKLHPNKEGHKLIAHKLWEFYERRRN